MMDHGMMDHGMVDDGRQTTHSGRHRRSYDKQVLRLDVFSLYKGEPN